MSARAEFILAVDTSGAHAGVVLAGSGRIDTAFLPLRPGGFARTEDLAAVVSGLLATQGRSARDLTLVGAVVGPGSYTGLRSGLAFLRGLAFADSLPAVAVGTLELLAWRGARIGETVVAVTPAGAGRHALAEYGRDVDDVVERRAPFLVEEAELEEVLAEIGSGRSAIVVESLPGERVVDESTRAESVQQSLPAGQSASAQMAPLADAARRAGLELRAAGKDALEQLFALVVSRSRRELTVRIDALLPTYVGQASARPNRHRVAVLDASE